MARRPKQERHSLDVVKAEDCYDPRDYILVHRNYFDGLREAVKKAHGDCICIYCRHKDKANENNGGDSR